ncbi:MAG: 30S ribosomal protein S16 [Deltaproteobacteria bacterium]|nr:30S ribosomal protein S16 [Deltaproteobacteria bacterium]
MSVKIRLARHGKKKKPFYRIVVADSKSPRNGRFIEIVGTYDPNENPAKIVLKDERISEWLGKGAVATDTVRSIIKDAGIGAKKDEKAA